jgi:hypothetical protein
VAIVKEEEEEERREPRTTEAKGCNKREARDIGN